MKIASIEAHPIRLPRDIEQATGTAGSPTVLSEGASDYRWSSVFPCLYSANFETAIVRITTDSGLVGWGEAQAPLVPEVACTIIDRLLAPVLIGLEFDGAPAEIESLWNRMYSTMRVRGQTGGFMLDAIAAIDIALWDLAGKTAGKPVCELLATSPKRRIPAYLSGLARGSRDTGEFDKVKLFYDTRDPDEFFAAWPGGVQVAVDGLWRHTPESALAFGREQDARHALWFEAPLPPEDAVAHGALARGLQTPIALGESYRTRFELAPFFEKAPCESCSLIWGGAVSPREWRLPRRPPGMASRWFRTLASLLGRRWPRRFISPRPHRAATWPNTILRCFVWPTVFCEPQSYCMVHRTWFRRNPALGSNLTLSRFRRVTVSESLSGQLILANMKKT